VHTQKFVFFALLFEEYDIVFFLKEATSFCEHGDEYLRHRISKIFLNFLDGLLLLTNDPGPWIKLFISCVVLSDMESDLLGLTTSICPRVDLPK
jgi:hypothetical protein